MLIFWPARRVTPRLTSRRQNLHRAELTALERAEHIAEWVRLTDEANKGASCADIPKSRGQPQGGINAAARELGIDRTEAQRAVKIAGIAPEAKSAPPACRHSRPILHQHGPAAMMRTGDGQARAGREDSTKSRAGTRADKGC